MKIEGTVLVGGEEIGTFSVGFDQVIMMHLNGGRWSPSWVFEWARTHNKSIELVQSR